MGMRKYLIKKVLTSAVTVFSLLTLNFFLFRILPGDPLRMMFHHARISPENWRLLKEQFGLDKPLFTQYFLYLVQLFRGNLGFSYYYKVPVSQLIVERLPNTLWLVIPTLIITSAIGILIGAVAAWKRGSKIDLAIMIFSLGTYAMPTFWLGMILMMIFSFYLGIFPTGGVYRPEITCSNVIEMFLDYIWHLFLPLITIVIIWVGEFAMIMRNTMVDVLTEDYIVTAKAKGLKETRIFIHHAVRNAMLPMVTLIFMNIGLLISGILVIETLFSWPGTGRLVYDALIRRDYPLLQGCFVFFATVMVVSNLIADIVYAYLDPRVKLSM